MCLEVGKDVDYFNTRFNSYLKNPYASGSKAELNV